MIWKQLVVFDMFTPHPNLNDDVNSNIVQSEIEGGVSLGDLSPSTVLEIETQNHRYTAVFLGESQAMISGHPEYCPEPTLVAISGSTWGGSMLKLRYIGRGMHLEFSHPEYHSPIVTSRIQAVRECANFRSETNSTKHRSTHTTEAQTAASPLRTRGNFIKPS